MKKGKKRRLIFMLALAVSLAASLAASQAAYANMAAPAEADVGSSITFEKNDTIAVTSEVLDIAVKGVKAEITATYKMKNTSDEAVSTKTMFLSPNVEDSGITVTAAGKPAPFTVESHVLTYATEVKTNDWRYAVLSDDEAASAGDSSQSVDSISFTMDFAPKEEYDVIVSYTYRLGGYPDYTFNAKYGRIEYYLAPAALWKDFEQLTVNLHLDKDMPVLKGSNLPFEKQGSRTYQYVSASLPEENLEITIDENWVQNIFSTLRSPYFRMTIRFLSPLILLIAGIVLLVIIRRWKRKKTN